MGALVVVSASCGTALEKLYEFKQDDLNAKCAAFPFPSLYITSDKDCQNAATTELYSSAAPVANMVCFKDEVLDLSMELTSETSIWKAAMKDMVPGLAQHFALAAERKLVSDAPIIAFLDEHLKGKATAELAPPRRSRRGAWDTASGP